MNTKLFFICCLLSATTFAQNLRGRITNEATGSPLPGVAIVLIGHQFGTTTNSDGDFSMKLGPGQYTLRFSSIGSETIERHVTIEAGENQRLNLALQISQTSLNEVTVVGSRNLNRSVTDSPAPIDLIDVRQVTSKTGQLDVNQLLQFVAPSFNSNRQTGSDGADHVDPASLRGLGPDQTLVLINGKRQHQSSLVTLFGTRGRGNTGTDLNTIPAAAIERIEILRDGAAAQYGSDAIAGVINIVLKTSTNQLNANVNYGAYQAKFRFDNQKFDGGNLNVNANYGWHIRETGFLNVTADFNQRQHTNRANTPGIDSTLQRRQFGDSKITNTSLYANAEIPLSDNTRMYAFGGLNSRKGDAYAWTRSADSPRNITSIYPDGFDPIITSAIVDKTFAAGVRTKINDWNVDFGNIFGSNRFDYGVKNTLNTSLGTSSPREFNAGGFQLQQNVTGLHFTRFFSNTLQGLNVAFGSEFRYEDYKIFAGEEASYKAYDVTRAAGSQGFPGFQPGNALTKSRINLGLYVDTEADLTKAFMIGAAARYENYSDFGSTLNGKLSSRLKISPSFLLRGTLSSGFRAPSLAQTYFNSTITNFVGGQAVQVQIAQNGSAITQALGVPPLKQETSVNASLGFTSHLGSGFTLTVDAYYVRIKDRVVLTGQFTDDLPAIAPELQKLNVSRVQFFTNAISTKTRGIDIVLAHHTLIGDGRLNTSLGMNFNSLDTIGVNTNAKLKPYKDLYFDLREYYFVKASAPPSKMNITVDYSINNWAFLLRVVRFGEVKLANWNYDAANLDIYRPKAATDLSISYRFTRQIGLSVGGSNIFNVYPDMHRADLTESGGAWDPVQMGFNGAYWFGKMNFKF
ncbi:TonB-dependent receptor [Spirosoma pollinicola]|uniref:TonB-dependent receptor n=1 Tax=Spirosoma pollinicola TaxID=2057025 RepID=A0A2K8Z622_9BACT|nr:TonB-dependent receptor [Spirosoma pollinicola]AUD05269.1 TonB-dependent receptor [Spirosoma pollinicola]